MVQHLTPTAVRSDKVVCHHRLGRRRRRFFLPSFVFRVFTLGLFVLEPNFLARDQFRPGPGADFFRTDAPLECVPRAAAAGWSVTTGVTTSCHYVLWALQIVPRI